MATTRKMFQIIFLICVLLAIGNSLPINQSGTEKVAETEPESIEPVLTPKRIPFVNVLMTYNGFHVTISPSTTPLKALVILFPLIAIAVSLILMSGMITHIYIIHFGKRQVVGRLSGADVKTKMIVVRIGQSLTNSDGKKKNEECQVKSSVVNCDVEKKEEEVKSSDEVKPEKEEKH